MLAVPHSTEVGEQLVSNVSQSSLLVLAGSVLRLYDSMYEPKIFLLSPGIRGLYIHLAFPIPFEAGSGSAVVVVLN
jgi:hypothetical protein